ncbi:MAG TPA: glycerophosphodiester phosphodiesterase [Usitatibacter sp.]|nr:glycerophosphodiester phosphodiesterase [Usitatibacter sp.]
MNAWPYPKLFAHRGGGSLAPENTLAAVKLGQSLGYRAHEFDVKLSKDGVAMLLHDATLDRTTTGRGRACDFTWEELRELDAGGWHSEPFRGEKLASFEAVARALIGRGDMANVEIKPTPGFERETGAAVSAEAARLWSGAEVPPLLSSFQYESLAAAKESAPHLPRGWLIDKFTDADWARLEALGAVSLHTDHKTFDVRNIGPLHARGYRVLLYTVNDVATAQRLLDAGVDGLFTDNLRVFAGKFPQLRAVA